MSSGSSDASSSSSSASSGSGEKAAKKQKVEEEHEKPKAAEVKEVAAVSSASSDDSDSSAGSSEDKKKKKKKDKKKDKKKSKKKKKKDVKKKKKKKDKGKEKGKDKKKKKKDNKEKKLSKKAQRNSVSMQFGKYGIIKAEDFYNKKPEFLCWAMEVKDMKTDGMGQMDMKNLFKEYIEDFNTATMPSKKYYNLQTWDTMMSKKLQKKNRGDDMNVAQKGALASFDDEKARREEIKHLQAKKQEDLITNEVRRMRTDKTKVTEMKKQDHLRTHMDMLQKAGHIKEANKIKESLEG